MRHVAAEVVLSRAEAVVDVCAFIAGASSCGCRAGGGTTAHITDAVVLSRAEAVVDVGAVAT